MREGEANRQREGQGVMNRDMGGVGRVYGQIWEGNGQTDMGG